MYGKIYSDSLQSSDSREYQELGKKIVLLPVAPPNASRYHFHWEIAKFNKAAFFINQEIMIEMSSISCDMIIAIDDVGRMPISGFVVAKGSPLREPLERG